MNTYSKKLRHPKWQKKRLEILNRDGFRCCLCGDKDTTLNVHHKKYKGDPWESDLEDLQTVCEHCHNAIHELEKPKYPDSCKDLSREIVKILKINSNEIPDNSAYCLAITKDGFVFGIDVDIVFSTRVNFGVKLNTFKQFYKDYAKIIGI